MEFTQEHLDKMWEIEQEILDVIHEVCCKYNIKYSLAYGTLIGAVRHKGFIPWDDDIDLMMPRKEYEKFKIAWQKENPKGYILMDYHTHHENTNTFMKIVKDNTTFLQDERAKALNFHKGIFVDIFPGDKLAANAISRKVQYVLVAMFLLFSRGYRSGTKGIIGTIEKLFLMIPRRKHYKIRCVLEKLIRHWNEKENTEVFFAATINDAKKVYPANMFDAFVEVPFNGKNYYAVANYDEMLRITYGDYMKLPPVEERVWRHHPLLIDFEHNYEDIKLSNL